MHTTLPDSEDSDALEAMLRMEEEGKRLQWNNPKEWRRVRQALERRGWIEVSPNIWASQSDLVAECNSKFTHPRKQPTPNGHPAGRSGKWYSQDRTRAWDFYPSADHDYVCRIDIPEECLDENLAPGWLANWPHSQDLSEAR